MLLFKDIKQNYPVYILDKSTMELIQGKVTQVSFPHIDSNRPSFPGNIQPMVVDVTIAANDKSATYTIPENLSITDAGPTLVLTTEQENLVHEVEAMKSNAESIISSIPHQKEVISKADKLLAELSPVYKDKAQYEERLKGLEDGMSDIKSMLAKMINNNEKK